MVLSLKVTWLAAAAMPLGPTRLTVVLGVNWAPPTVTVTSPTFAPLLGVTLEMLNGSDCKTSEKLVPAAARELPWSRR